MKLHTCLGGEASTHLVLHFHHRLRCGRSWGLFQTQCIRKVGIYKSSRDSGVCRGGGWVYATGSLGRKCASWERLGGESCPLWGSVGGWRGRGGNEISAGSRRERRRDKQCGRYTEASWWLFVVMFVNYRLAVMEGKFEHVQNIPLSLF